MEHSNGVLVVNFSQTYYYNDSLQIGHQNIQVFCYHLLHKKILTFFFSALVFLLKLEFCFFNSLRLSSSLPVLLPFQSPTFILFLLLYAITFLLSVFERDLQLGIYLVSMVTSYLQAPSWYQPPVLTALTLLFLDTYYSNS